MILSTHVERQAKKHLIMIFKDQVNAYEHIISKSEWDKFVRDCTVRCNEVTLYYPTLFPTKTQVNELINRCVIKWAVRYFDKMHDEYKDGTPDKPEFLTV